MNDLFPCPKCTFVSANLTELGQHMRHSHPSEDNYPRDRYSERLTDSANEGDLFPTDLPEDAEWVLVPRHLTKAMVIAMEAAYEDAKDRNYDSGGDGRQYNSYEHLPSYGYAEIWKAALDAAPKKG